MTAASPGTRACGVGIALLALVLGAGCGRAREAIGGAPASGTLEGRVRLVPGAQLPAYAPFDLARSPLLPDAGAKPPADCEAALARARTPVVADAEGLLAGVIVAASDFARAPSRPAREHRVAIENCRLQPSAIAATQGDKLAIINRDAFAFEPLFGPSLHPRALAQGKQLRFPLEPGVDSVRCDRSAPCGRADVVVFKHPVHAVTSAGGAFRIEGFPANELVRVSAWHPLFEESETFVWVEPGKHMRVELVIAPKLRFATPPPAPPPAAGPGSTR